MKINLVHIKSFLANLVGICVLLGTIGTFLFGPFVREQKAKFIQEFLDSEEFQEVLHDKFEELSANKTGGFRAKLGQEMGLDPMIVPKALTDAYKEAREATVAIDTFRSRYQKLLDHELIWFRVGLRVNRSTGQIKYDHVDMYDYSPAYSEIQRAYYILTPDGNTQWCY